MLLSLGMHYFGTGGTEGMIVCRFFLLQKVCRNMQQTGKGAEPPQTQESPQCNEGGGFGVGGIKRFVLVYITTLFTNKSVKIAYFDFYCPF